MTIHMEEEAEIPFSFDYHQLAEKVITYTADRQQFPFESEISILLTDHAGIRDINSRLRNINKTTDVLSFPLIDYPSAGCFDDIEKTDDNFNPDTGEAMLGDIVINVDKVLEQAEAYGHSIQREFAFLIVHSMLHLFGYDHLTPDDAAQMEPLQKTILEELSIKR